MAELELEQLFASKGFQVIGKKEVKHYKNNSILSVRYSEKDVKNSYKNKIGRDILLVIKDHNSDKTLATIESIQRFTIHQNKFDQISRKLDKLL